MVTKKHPLKSWREGRDMSVADAAKAARVTRSAWNRYEVGSRTPAQGVMDRIIVLTAGAVSANDWVGSQAAEVLAVRQGGKEAGDVVATQPAI